MLKDIFNVKAGEVFPVNGNGFIEITFGWNDIREFPVFILKRNPEWFKDVTKDYMTNEQRLEQIRVGFKKIKEAYDWVQTHDDSKFLEDKLLPALEQVYIELESLGVEREFSAGLFVTGGTADVGQF